MTFVLMPVMLIVISWFMAPLMWARWLLIAGRFAAGLKSAWIDIDGRRWHYLEGGKGPVLIALHGFGGDADNWLRIARGLGKHFRVIAPDLPGFGASDPGDGLAFDIDSQVTRLNAFVRTLGVRPSMVVGSSMGGWIAAAYAARYPGPLRALWLLAPLGVYNSNKSSTLEAIDRDQESPFQIANRHQFKQRVVVPMFGQLPWIPYPLMVFYAQRAIEQSEAGRRKFMQVLNDSAPLEKSAAMIEIPVLLQWGAKDCVVDVSGVAALEQVIPDLSVRVQDKIGHLPMLEAPGESLGFFFDFCAQHQLLSADQAGGC